jgi:glyoxylase-like metal-dependent hydrolase (beta-lactamase superfamily II)
LSSINGAPRKLDAGVLFGSTPRGIWGQWLLPDQDNQIELASRALLVQENGRNTLVLAGSESLLAPQQRSCRCQRHVPGLLDGLARLGLSEDDIDLVLLTHLHAWPSLAQSKAYDEGVMLRLLFPRAKYFTGERHWRRAQRPHPHDRSRFVSGILSQLEGSGRLQLIEGGHSSELGNGWFLHVSDGYTPGQLLPEISLLGGPLLFAGDLIPATHWLDLPVTSGLDRDPEGLIGEKEWILDHMVQTHGRLFMARDPIHAVVKVSRDRQSRYKPYEYAALLSRQEI